MHVSAILVTGERPPVASDSSADVLSLVRKDQKKNGERESLACVGGTWERSMPECKLPAAMP